MVHLVLIRHGQSEWNSQNKFTGWVDIDLSDKGKKVIQKLIKGDKVSMEESGLSKREWNELMEAFNLKDKLI